MMVTRRVQLAVAVPAAFVALAALSVTGSNAADQPADRSNAWSAADNGVFTTPAEAGADPSIDRQDVEGRYAAYTSAEPDLVELVSYRDDVRGDIQPDGSVRLSHRDTLAWALVRHNVGVPFYGGMNSTPPPPRTCDYIDLLDADSGVLILGFFDCNADV